VQDKLALDAEEKKAIELKRELVNGQERTVWNSSLSIPRRDFEFSEVGVARIKASLGAWEDFAAAGDRQWLEPLLDALSSPETRRPADPISSSGAMCETRPSGNR
jgi:hypothetical protein